MPARSKALLLPVGIRRQLDNRLRERGYGGLVALSDWLRQQGHVIGKSALHTYCEALRQADAESGAIDAILAGRKSADAQTAEGMRDALLLELGRIRLREHQILLKLVDMNGQD